MDRPVMFNGRLNKSELDTWIDLLSDTSESVLKDRDLAKAFLMLEESISFVSSLENEVIGGTSIFKDKTRLAMVLTSVVVKKELRESVSYQIIKSSLPFFRTVAIRDVDALVSTNGDTNVLGFPLSLELDSWVADILKRIGFQEVGILEQYSFEVGDVIKESTINWNKEIMNENVRELIWDQSKPMGLTNSYVWLALDFAKNSSCLEIAVAKGEIAAVAGFWELSDTLCISPIVTDPLRLSWSKVAKSLMAEAARKSAKRIVLPIIGEGQKDLVRTLEQMCKRSACRKLSLMRKPL